MSEQSDTPKFVFLLNAMEAAGWAESPARHDYGGKRALVLDYVARLERELSEVTRDRNDLQDALTTANRIVGEFADKLSAAEGELHKRRERGMQLDGLLFMHEGVLVTSERHGDLLIPIYQVVSISDYESQAWQTLRREKEAAEGELDELRGKLAEKDEALRHFVACVKSDSQMMFYHGANLCERFADATPPEK